MRPAAEHTRKTEAAGWLLLCQFLLLPLALTADPVDFESEVLPILVNRCVICHGAKQHYSNLRLDSKAGILRGGELGEAVVAGNPDSSPLYDRTSLDPDDLDFMPVEGEPLSSEEQKTLRRWIEEGVDFGTWTDLS